jgi:hypothetical protein
MVSLILEVNSDVARARWTRTACLVTLSQEQPFFLFV